MALRFLLIPALVVILVSSLTAPASAEFIWRDRWNRMDQLFRFGYVEGVSDLIHMFFGIAPARVGIPADAWAARKMQLLRDANQCITSKAFKSIKEATDFAGQALSDESDPQIFAAFVIFRSLVLCSNNEDADYISTDPVAKDFTGFEWKDRWDQESSAFRDGYASGVFDMIQHLDNAGKTREVLLYDVFRAHQCSYTLDLHTGGKLLDFVRKSIEGPSHRDPLESTSGTIFEVLRACRKV